MKLPDKVFTAEYYDKCWKKSATKMLVTKESMNFTPNEIALFRNTYEQGMIDLIKTLLSAKEGE